ncbi:MAG: mannose-6-phosphate isomerase [Saprospiraceae bacterium]|jgi:mannose-6-phosphate isomerase
MQEEGIFQEMESELIKQGFSFERMDFKRPWGGFFVIEESQAEKFITRYFDGESALALTKGAKVSPKILIVLPQKRLSWQYHHRRSEVWRVAGGSVGIVRSDSDEQGDVVALKINDQVVLSKGERHRLVGLDEVGIVAEIWQHTEPNHPSDEDDIVRLQDDFGR